MTLYEAIKRHAPVHWQGIIKHLTIVGITSFDDCGKRQLDDFKDYMVENVAPNTAKVYFTELKSIFNHYADEESGIYSKYKEILRIRGEQSMKTYLTLAELKRLEMVECKTDIERCTLYTFLISAYTGCRISDAKELTLANISGNSISYVSKKTSIQSTIPCKPQLSKWISYVNSKNFKSNLSVYNYTLQTLCRRARINDIVTTYKAGKTYQMAKWKSITSHSGRVSFATNLANLHAPLLDICRLMGHKDPNMTINYIVKTNVELPQETMKFFK